MMLSFRHMLWCPWLLLSRAEAADVATRVSEWPFLV